MSRGNSILEGKKLSGEKVDKSLSHYNLAAQACTVLVVVVSIDKSPTTLVGGAVLSE